MAEVFRLFDDGRFRIARGRATFSTRLKRVRTRQDPDWTSQNPARTRQDPDLNRQWIVDVQRRTRINAHFSRKINLASPEPRAEPTQAPVSSGQKSFCASRSDSNFMSGRIGVLLLCLRK